MNKKIWKNWDFGDMKFEIKDFSNYELENKFGLNFFYYEIFDWGHSKTKCIYEMSDCIIEKNDIVVDLGSNIGLFTKLATEKTNNKIISVEGSPEIFSCLVENLNDDKNVFFLNANVISETNKESNSWSKKSSIINVTLKDIFHLYNLESIDFLKIDIEGGEYSLFRDLDDEYLKKIKKIAIETHDKNLNQELANKITKNGKKLFFFNWYHGPEEPQTMFYFY